LEPLLSNLTNDSKQKSVIEKKYKIQKGKKIIMDFNRRLFSLREISLDKHKSPTHHYRAGLTKEPLNLFQRKRRSSRSNSRVRERVGKIDELLKSSRNDKSRTLKSRKESIGKIKRRGSTGSKQRKSSRRTSRKRREVLSPKLNEILDKTNHSGLRGSDWRKPNIFQEKSYKFQSRRNVDAGEMDLSRNSSGGRRRLSYKGIKKGRRSSRRKSSRNGKTGLVNTLENSIKKAKEIMSKGKLDVKVSKLNLEEDSNKENLIMRTRK
jgi:hypothetical protein